MKSKYAHSAHVVQDVSVGNRVSKKVMDISVLSADTGQNCVRKTSETRMYKRTLHEQRSTLQRGSEATWGRCALSS